MSIAAPEGKNALTRSIDLVFVAKKACERLRTSWLGFWLGSFRRKS
jgi:hypothetical protein